jgi:hypothetical protein
LIAGVVTIFASGLFIAQAATEGGESAVLYVPGVLGVAVGIPLLSVGLFDRKTVWVRQKARLELTPVVGRGQAGGSARFRF